MNAIQLAKFLTEAAACLTLFSLTASAQEDFDPAKMEELKKKYWSPGKEHKVLRSWAGTWKTKNSFWGQPGAPPMTSEGESKFRMLFKGRYLSEPFSAKSEEMGEFKGQGTLACASRLRRDERAPSYEEEDPEQEGHDDQAEVTSFAATPFSGRGPSNSARPCW
jgi:hypothetical protein